MDNGKIISEIKRIYEKYILKDANTFCVDDYNKFEEEIWMLKEKYRSKIAHSCCCPNQLGMLITK